MTAREFAKLVNLYRIEHGCSTTEIARIVGVSRCTIYAWLKKRVNAQIDQRYWQAIERLRIDDGDLIAGTPEAAACLRAFEKYQQQDDIHEEEKNMSGQMFEAGWEAAKRFWKVSAR